MTPYYQDDAVTIYHGDCRFLMPQLPGWFDLLLTDPPYGIGAGTMTMGRGSRNDNGVHERSEWDLKPADEFLIQLGLSISHSAIIWGGNYFNLPPSRRWLIWDKCDPNSDFASAELAWTNLDGVVKTFAMSRKRNSLMGGQHPTQKPLGLMVWCMEFVPDANTVLDPFMGSGTTLRAAKDLGRKAIGIEIEERYCEIAAKRMAQEVLDFTP